MTSDRRLIRVGEHEVDVAGLVWEHPGRGMPRLSLLPVFSPGGYPSPFSTSSLALVRAALEAGLEAGADDAGLGWATAISYVTGLGRLAEWLFATDRVAPGCTWDFAALNVRVARGLLSHVKATKSKNQVLMTRNAIWFVYSHGVAQNHTGLSRILATEIKEISPKELGTVEDEGGVFPLIVLPREPGLPPIPDSFECRDKVVRIEGAQMSRAGEKSAVGLERIVRPAGRPPVLSRRAQQLVLLHTVDEISSGNWSRHQILNAADRFGQWLASRPEWRSSSERFDWSHLSPHLAASFFEEVQNEPKGRDWWIYLRGLYRWGVHKRLEEFDSRVEHELLSVGVGRGRTVHKTESEDNATSRFRPDPALPPIPPVFGTRDQKYTVRTASPIWRRYDESGQPQGSAVNLALLDDPPGGPDDAVYTLRFLHIVRLYIVSQASKRWSWKTIPTFVTLLRELQSWLRTHRDMEPNKFGVAQLTPGLLAAYKLHMESDEGPGFSSRLSMLRTLYEWGLRRRLPGFEKDTMERLKELPFTNNPRGEIVKIIDPVRGAFSMTEQSVLKDVLEDPDWGTVEEKALVRLCWDLGPRPVQIAQLRVKHLEKYVSPHDITYIIRVPRAKKGVPTEATVPRGVSDLLGRFLEQLCPPGCDPERELFPSLSGKLDKETAINSMLKRWAYRRGPGPLRTRRVLEGGEPARLPIHPYRFRRTMATNLARQRASAEYIAQMLDDDDIRMALVYTENISELVDVLGEVLDAGEYLDIMGGFLGRWESQSDRSLPVIQQVAVEGPGRETMLDLGGTGRCGKGALCELAWPMSCYACRKFRPREGGPHEQMLANVDAIIASKRQHRPDRMIVVYQHIRERIAIVVEAERRRQQTSPPSEGEVHV